MISLLWVVTIRKRVIRNRNGRSARTYYWKICRRSPVLPERHPSPTVSMNMLSEVCSTVSITLTTVNTCSKPTDVTTVHPVSRKTAVSVSSLLSPPDGAFRKKHS